jgi:2-C-methyl-D-erythritol 4-phosphate cytidylyltransferase
LKGVVLLLAAGEGARLGGSEPKAFLDLAGTPVIRHAYEAILSAELVEAIVVAAPAGYERRIESLLPPDSKPVTIVTGGVTRQASAAAALDAAPTGDAYLVHDAARALAPSALFDAVLRELDECEAVVPALPLVDTIKETAEDHVVRTIDRSALVAVQTPQGFRADVYRRAHAAAAKDGFAGTDDAALVERLGVRVRIVPGDDRNMKITTAHDAAVAEGLLGAGR